VHLLPRLYDAQKGSILFNGVDIKEIPEVTLRNGLSLVLQKPILFSGTIRDNILQGKLDATEAELVAAADIAQASEFINKLDTGYDSPVEQRGNNFSGGQKQRISIARGIIKNPAILIFDDSTSALDAKSEGLVREGLKTNFKKTTKITVSQKISSIVDCDQIIVLDEGSIVAIGTHKALVKSSKIYAEIFKTQRDDTLAEGGK